MWHRFKAAARRKTRSGMGPDLDVRSIRSDRVGPLQGVRVGPGGAVLTRRRSVRCRPFSGGVRPLGCPAVPGGSRFRCVRQPSRASPRLPQRGGRRPSRSAGTRSRPRRQEGPGTCIRRSSRTRPRARACTYSSRHLARCSSLLPDHGSSRRPHPGRARSNDARSLEPFIFARAIWSRMRALSYYAGILESTG